MTNRPPSAVRYGLRSLGGLMGAGIAAAVVGFLCVVPLPNFTATARSELVNPTPTDQRLVCPGSLIDILSVDGDAITFAAVGSPDYVSAASDTVITQTTLDAPDVTSAGPLSLPQQLFAPAPTTDVTPRISGSQSQETRSETLTGLATSACVESGTDLWLVGGSTQTGRTTLLLLSNPTEVDARVDVAVMSERGDATGPGASGIVVSAGTQRVVSLAAIAPNITTPVVHVMSSGGQVVANLQQSVVRTLLPDGVELVSPSAAPNVSLIIPGVRLSGLTSGHGNEGGQVTSDQEPAVRVGVPGRLDANVTVTAYGLTSKPVSVQATVRAGRVMELPFGDLEDGLYTVVVTATQPVVAAARTVQDATVDPFAASTATPTPSGTSTPNPSNAPLPSPTASASASPRAAAQTVSTPGLATYDNIGEDAGPPASGPLDGGTSTPGSGTVASPVGGDFTWFPATGALRGDTQVDVPTGPHPTLTIYNPSTSDVVVSVSEDGKKRTDLTLAAKSMQVVTLTPGGRFVLSANDPVYATVTFAAKGLGASIGLSPPSPLASGLVVFPR